MEVTSRVRNYVYREFFERDEQVPHMSAPSPADGAGELEPASRNNVPPLTETQAGSGPVASTPPSSSSASAPQKVKVSRIAPIFSPREKMDKCCYFVDHNYYRA